MKSVLEKLYNGNLVPYEDAVPKSEDYKNNLSKINKKLEKIKSKISEEEFKNIEEILDLQSEICSIENINNFVYGFKLSTAILSESFVNDKS